jgi:hypothetical protein
MKEMKREITSALMWLLIVTISIARGQTPISRTAADSSEHQLKNLLAQRHAQRRGFSLMPPSFSISAMAAGPSLTVLGGGTLGRLTKWVGFTSSNSFIGDSTIFEDKYGLVGIGTDSPTSKLTVAGVIQSTAGGFKFADGTVQTTSAAGSLFTVAHDATLTGNGTSASPLGVAVPLSLTGSLGATILTLEGIITATNTAPAGTGDGGIGVLGKSNDGIGVNGTVEDAFILGNPKVGVLGAAFTGTGVLGNSNSGAGVSGNSGSGVGVRGFSSSGRGVRGNSNSSVGVEGISTSGAGVRGESTSSTGVQGVSSSGHCVVATSTGSGDLFGGFGGGSERFRVDNDGDVFAKSYNPLSDVRVKTNIRPLIHTLDKLQQIRGISFEWTNANPSPAPREIGVIAQEVEAVFPELVKAWGDQGYKGVSYDGLTALLLEGVKSLKVENDGLKAEDKALRARLDVLEKLVKELKQPSRR